MAPKIALAVPENIPLMLDINFAVFDDNPEFALLPNKEKHREAWEIMITQEMESPNSVVLKVIDDSEDTQTTILAWAHWTMPADSAEIHPPFADSDSFPDFNEYGFDWSGADNAEAWADYHKRLWNLRKQVLEKPYWCLALLVTHPQYQGRGAGSLLIRYGLNKADETQTEVYLESSPMAISLYKKFGFQEKARAEITVGDIYFWNVAMLRAPSPGHYISG
ncbi:acyl-CoA N-acyltransferase [Penicillium herquei]|nr:acyl-CoA N-acyltransferase [Penicillium herquei]